MLFAKLRFFENHWGIIPTVATKRKPIPKPKATPWARKSCHISVAKDAPRRPAVCERMPILSVVCVPNLREHMVATGETTRDMEIESPPIKAYSRADALGYVLKVK